MTSQPERPTRKAQLKPARFLDPKSDIVFKKIFGEHPELTISFLNGVLPLPQGGLITSISYLPTEQSPRIPIMKNTIVDVKCTDEKGRVFIVEMQFNWSTNFMKRLLFGVSKAYVQQLDRGDNYHSLCPVYGLDIVNDVFDPTDEWYHHYRSVNVKDTNKVLPGLELIFLELPKFKPQTTEHRRMGVLWLRFLREIDEKSVDVPEDFTNDPYLSQALEIAQESGYTAAELDTYDRYWDAVRVEKTVARDAKEIGFTPGREEGRVEGRVEGRAEGVAEATETFAIRMIKKGSPLQDISEMTGLSLDDLHSLASKIR